MLLGESSPQVIPHFSGKFNDVTHWKWYTIPEQCLSTKQLRTPLWTHRSALPPAPAPVFRPVYQEEIQKRFQSWREITSPALAA
jgi:hypothetical protein